MKIKIKKPLARAKVSNIILIECYTIYNYFRYKTAATAPCDNDLIFALSINAEEEIEYSERSANWTEIKAVVEEDAHEKGKLIFPPVSVQDLVSGSLFTCCFNRQS